ncbi:unnamed protein product [marine sediment metagenome]|uniref:Uncharacterized protein n=1 Tax=marine sediment metagenome TaxID=412755 RepID=X1TFJ3_9ZZZZ
MTEEIKDIGKVFIDKDGAYRIYIGKKIVQLGLFKNMERVKIICYPEEKRIVIMEF